MTPATPVLQVALNGDSPHPAMPRTPREIADDAAACVAAGATLLHVHAFDDDGAETLAAEPVARVLRAVRERCPDLPISMTTFADIEPDPEVRKRLVTSWTELPDLVSANQGESGIDELSEHLAARGVGVEACLLSMDDAEIFVASGSASRFRRVVIEAMDDDADDAVANAAAMESLVTGAGIGLEQLHHGIGPASWAVSERAARRGHGIRTGVEDTGLLPDGSPAAGNVDLVRAAAAIVQAARAGR